MEWEKVLKLLHRLARLDIDAWHAYDQAIERCDKEGEAGIRDKLAQFREDHRRHAEPVRNRGICWRPKAPAQNACDDHRQQEPRRVLHQECDEVVVAPARGGMLAQQIGRVALAVVLELVSSAFQVGLRQEPRCMHSLHDSTSEPKLRLDGLEYVGPGPWVVVEAV